MRFNARSMPEFSFFGYISNTYGKNTVNLLKKWIHHNKDLVKTKARNKYLLLCKRSNIVPKHLINYRSCKLKFHNDYLSSRADSHLRRLALQLLNLEISDNFKYLKVLITSLYRVTRAIERSLPVYICNEFFNTQTRSLSKLFMREKNRMRRKFSWNMDMNCVNDSYLKASRLNRIKNIKYSCSIAKTEDNNEFSIRLLGSGPTNDLHNDSDDVHA